jgi:hypothetical protein
MKKSLLSALIIALAVLLAGCATKRPAPAPAPAPAPVMVPEPEPVPEPVPEPEPPAISVLLVEMQSKTAAFIAAGGLAALGTAESKSLDLALNKAKADGRKELARLLTVRVEALDKAFTEEAGIPADALILSGFNNATRIINQQIAGSVAHTLKYETAGDLFTAYAVMVLDPKVIADQLAKEKELYERLQKTKAFEAFNQAAQSFAAFTALQK